MSSYCCFTCPSADYSEKELTDKCPTCHRQYGFPLLNSPTEINGYKITRPLARGFYSVTYVAEYGRLGDTCVLKVSSQELYKFFKKDFEAECRTHRRVAVDSEHVVGIRDMFDADVSFGDFVVPCHVALLNYVDGVSLDKYLAEAQDLTSRSIAQIGIDLFRIIGDLENKEIYHNDLHSGNIIIQQLARDARRAEAIDGRIRAVVIDLGSVSDNSKSGEQRLGDLHWVAMHLRTLSRHLLNNAEGAQDTEYRLASLLDERASLLEPQVLNQRRPSVEECINDIRDAFNQVLSPWKESLTLNRFDDAYNAQTLAPWFVPMLLEDPQGHWRAAMSTKGSQVIIGMRGCGKTMLLRSLQFHARATPEGEREEAVLDRLRQDGYVGLYVSCMRLLDAGGSSRELIDPYARLLIAFGLEALRAARHLQEINAELVVGSYYKEIAEGVAHYLSSPESLNTVGSEFELERRLIEIQVALGSGDDRYKLTGQTIDAFTHLARAVRKCSSLWSNHYVLFLLDDVSTRYLNEPRILELLSELTFQSPDCAFKMSTEAQTLELGLRSPGRIEKARLGRDYAVFDLGAEVYAKVRDRQGKFFVEKILKKRAKYYPNHPPAGPGQVLGDTSLEAIAEKIVTTPDTSRQKKEIYHGISALSGICVGDIGDVISIYELILKNAVGRETPVSPYIQSDSFQKFYARRLYDLNRREGRLKDFAQSFADASHQLLLQSADTRKNGKLKRLRQYNKIYVRITTGDFEKQFKQLRDLIDAGVFILDGGSDTPRGKTKDADPIQQFVITFRKLFGLGHYIGLAERDRFELSGDQLIEWLDHPARGADILMRNLKVDTVEVEDEEISVSGYEVTPDTTEQPKLFETAITIGDVFQPTRGEEQRLTEEYIKSKTSRVKVLVPEELKQLTVDTLVLGLGFETRTLTSAERLYQLLSPSEVLFIEYQEPGYSEDMKALAARHGWKARVVPYESIGSEGLDVRGNTFVDVTGLAKPALFQSVKSGLKQTGKIWICDTRAEVYYPHNEDIKTVLEAERNLDHYGQLDALRKILTGEKGRYDCVKQLISDADESRRRILCAFSSAKHERLLTLLDERDYDRIELVAPKGESPRSHLARIAADVAINNYANTALTLIDSHDLPGALDFLTRIYQAWYVKGGFNFELALTGSKLQAVACATISAALKVSQCWYVSPLRFDIKRFTIGAKESTYFEVSLPDEYESTFSGQTI